MNNSGKAVRLSAVSGKIASVIGYTLGAFALIIIVLAIPDLHIEGAVTSMIISIMVLPICAFLIYKGIQIKKRISRFNTYVSIISTRQITPLGNIAERTAQPVSFVRKDLQKMIDKKFFTHAYIDMKTDELVIDWRDGANFGNERPVQSDTKAEVKTEESGCFESGAEASEAKEKSVNFIEYVAMKEDLIAAYAHDMKKPIAQRFLVSYLAFYLLAFIYFCLLWLLYYLEAPTPLFLITVLAIPVTGIFLAVFFSRRRRAARIVEGRLKRGEIEPQYFGRHRLELKNNAIEMHYGTVCAQREYAGIQKTVEYPGGIIVYNSQLDIDVIPSAAFADAAHRRAFINDLQAKIVQAKSVRAKEQDAPGHELESSYEVEYIWNEESFIPAMMRAGRLLYETRIAWTKGQIIMTLAGSFLSLAGAAGLIRMLSDLNEVRGGIIEILPSAFCMAIGIGLLSPLLMAFTPLGKLHYRRQIDSGAIPRDFFDNVSLSIKEDRITEKRSLSSYDVMYERVYCVKYDADCMYILMKDKRVYIIPDSAFHPNDRKREIAEYINEKINGTEPLMLKDESDSSRNTFFRRIMYLITSYLCVIVFIFSWMLNFGWTRLLLIIPMLIHAAVFCFSNFFYSKFNYAGKKIRFVNYCVYITYLLCYALLPDMLDDAGNQAAVFGLVKNSPIINTLDSIAWSLFYVNVILIVFQIVYSAVDRYKRKKAKREAAGI